MKLTFRLLILVVLISACTPKQKADLLIVNAKVYTINDLQKEATAIAIKDGKFIAVGNSEKLSSFYEADKVFRNGIGCSKN